MDLEITIVSEVNQTENLICGIQKNGTNERIYKTDTDYASIKKKKKELWLIQ